MFDVTLTNNFQYQSQYVDTENTICQDQRINSRITDKNLKKYYLCSIHDQYISPVFNSSS